MLSKFSEIDLLVFALYGISLVVTGYFLNRRANDSTDFFLGSKQMSFWAVGVSVLATSQSAATFLGGPDQGYRGDLTYLSSNIASIIAAVFVATFLLPRFYAMKVFTVYELLGQRFGNNARYQAGLVYLLGRLFASGARLFMAAIAVSMILFGDVQPSSVSIAIFIISSVGLMYTVYGGIRAVIYSDVLQCLIYVGAAALLLVHLTQSIPLSLSEIIAVLESPSLQGQNDHPSKLTLFNTALDFSSQGAFNLWSILTGLVLLNIASFGLDQDMTQRMLTCKDAKRASKALLTSVTLGIPVVFLFICIGLLLFIYYQRPDIMAQATSTGPVPQFEGETVTIFMYYILTDLPNGIKAIVTIGIIAAALSTLNSGLNSMSSVAVQDIYRSWIRAGQELSEFHLVAAGRVAMAIVAVCLGLVAMGCYYVQKATDAPLLAFALSVMVFSYSGLLGIYFTAVFTKRGSPASIVAALVIGFCLPVLMHPFTQTYYLPEYWQFNLAFSWQLVIATTMATLVCLAGKPTADGFEETFA